MFHVNHAVKVDKFSKFVIASCDTDVFVFALYYFSHWMFLCLHSTILVTGCIMDWSNCGLLVENVTVSTLH